MYSRGIGCGELSVVRGAPEKAPDVGALVHKREGRKTEKNATGHKHTVDRVSDESLCKYHLHNYQKPCGIMMWCYRSSLVVQPVQFSPVQSSTSHSELD